MKKNNGIKVGDRVKTPCGEGVVAEIKKGIIIVNLDNLYTAEFFKDLVKPIKNG